MPASGGNEVCSICYPYQHCEQPPSLIMLSSGPKSYYDEYVRKKDTERVFAKPPALLTDRNAYINFLEVQLERVSAACFAVHGHESRFNDMQGLVVSMDEKLNTSNRMLSVTQQSTEEVRAEFHQRAEIESNAAKSYRLENRNAIEALTSRILQMEKIACLLPQIEGKLNAFDKRMGEYETKQRSIEQESRIANKVLHERIETLDSVKDELYALIESTRASVSRVTFDVEENTTRVSNYMSGIENRINLSVQDSREDLQRELSALQAKGTNQYEEVRRLIEVRDLELLATTRKHHQVVQEEVEESRRKWTQDLESLTTHLLTDAARKVESVQHSVNTGLQDLRASQHHQAAMMCDIEEGLLAQLSTVQSHVEEVSVHQKSVEEKLNMTNKSLEERIQELQTTLNNTTLNNTLHNTTLPHPAWGPPPFYPPAPPGSHFAGASFMGESFGPGGGAPLSPVTRAADGSFFYGGYPLNASFAHQSQGVQNNTGVVPFPINVSRPGTVPTSPISVHTHSTHATNGTHHTQGTRHTRPASISPGNSRSTSVSRRFAQAKTRSHSRSASPGTRADTSGSGMLRGARKKKVDASAEVIQKFLEIYDADQQDISRRLEEMGAPPPATKTTTRKKQHKPTEGETPGEVLGNFFLSYKKDRQDILSRLNSLVGTSEEKTQEGRGDKEGSDSEEGSDTEYGDAVKASPRGAAVLTSSSQRPNTRPSNAGSVQDTSVYGGDSTRGGSVHTVPSVRSERPVGLSSSQSHDAVNESAGSGSTDPAGRVVESIVSQSMDAFMKTYRNRGSKRTVKTPRTTSSASLLHDDDADSAIDMDSLHTASQRNARSSSKSPNRLRLRTGALLTSLRDSGGRDRFKRYMQMTESQSLAQSMSPNGTPGAVDVSAVRWEYDNVALKPTWKVPNTYQSPGRVRSNSQGNSQSNSRAGSISPGARTASSLIDRLLRSDRYATTHSVREVAPLSVSVSFAAPVSEAVLQHASHATQTKGTCDCSDSVSVASSVTTKTTTTSSSSHKH